MVLKINLDHTTCICTFLQALSLYFHYDEWDFATVIPFQIALKKRIEITAVERSVANVAPLRTTASNKINQIIFAPGRQNFILCK
jgi:hypothetical protein